MKRRKLRARRVPTSQPGSGASRGGGLLPVLAMLVPAAAVVSVGVALLLILDLRPEAGRDRVTALEPVAGENPLAALPRYVLAAPPETQAAYLFALEQADVLGYIPCYCGCGPIGHVSVRDCFLKQVGPDIVEFDEHGSGCGICVGIALDVKEQLAQGKSLSEIRSYIDGKYASIGPGTDTPLPPE